MSIVTIGRLEKQAKQMAEKRLHTLKRFKTIRSDMFRTQRVSVCEDCGHDVIVDTNPPKGVDKISGLAIEASCEVLELKNLG